MSSPRPRPLTGATNELAKERNRAAAERTLTSWIGNCLTLISFGVAFDQIYQTWQTRLIDRQVAISIQTARTMGLLFIAMGLGLLGLALAQHRLMIKTIEDEAYILSSVSAMNRLAVSAILLFGLAGIITILFFQ
jgi:putative membrane protein